MADDKVFRPQKKPIQPSEVNESTAAENLSKLQEMEQFRKAVAQEDTSDFDNPIPNFSESPIQITGNIPPQLRNFLPGNKKKTQPQQNQNFVEQPQNYVMGQNPKLQAVLNSIQESTFNYDEIRLPSLGKFYNGEDGPTDGIVHVRPMTGREEQILATSRFVMHGQAINMIFKNCMQEKYNTENFLVQDRTYLLIYLRGISYSTSYEVELKCPYSDQKFTHVINLSEIMVDHCPPEFGLASLHGVLPRTGLEFSYRLATGVDERLLNEHRQKKAKDFALDEDGDDTLMYRNILAITEIAGLSSNIEKREILKNLPIEDTSFLRNTVNTPPFGVETTIEVMSPYRGETFEVELPLEAHFFFPKARKVLSRNPA